MADRQANLCRVAWAQLIEDLCRAGLGIEQQAKNIEVGRSTVIGWRRDGIEPRHEYGEAIVALWCSTLRRTRDDLPMQPRDLYVDRYRVQVERSGPRVDVARLPPMFRPWPADDEGGNTLRQTTSTGEHNGGHPPESATQTAATAWRPPKDRRTP